MPTRCSRQRSVVQAMTEGEIATSRTAERQRLRSTRRTPSRVISAPRLLFTVPALVDQAITSNLQPRDLRLRAQLVEMLIELRARLRSMKSVICKDSEKHSLQNLRPKRQKSTTLEVLRSSSTSSFWAQIRRILSPWYSPRVKLRTHFRPRWSTKTL